MDVSVVVLESHDVTYFILFNLGIPSFNTVVHNSKYVSRASWCNSHNSIVEHLESVCGL